MSVARCPECWGSGFLRVNQSGMDPDGDPYEMSTVHPCEYCTDGRVVVKRIKERKVKAARKATAPAPLTDKLRRLMGVQ